MNAMWQMWENRFSKAACERIISLGNLLPEKQAEVGGGEIGYIDKEVRRSKIRWLSGAMPDFKDLYLDLVDMFHQSNKLAFGAELWHLHELQFTCYNSEDQGCYDWHNDVLWQSTNPSHRKLSMVIQLSDPNNYEGGDFEMQPLFLKSPDLAVLKKQGTTIIFPSFINHRVTPVTKGTHYSLVSCMEGQKWR